MVILVILASTGVRNAGLRDLLTESVNLSRREQRVIGKERIIPFGAGAAEALRTYSEELRPLLAPSPYFIVNPASVHGHNWGRMGERSLADLVKLLLSEAGIAGSKNPHRFRHSYATMVVRQTANLEVSRELLGHSDIKTTSHYVHTNSQDRHDAADKVDLVPRSEVTETPPVTTPVSPSPPPTVDSEPHSEEHHVELLPVERPASPQRLAAGHLVQDDQVAAHRNLQNRTGEQLLEAVEVARRLPPRLLVHLNSERLVGVALGSCITTRLNTEVFLATAGVVLSWAHGLPLPLDNLLATYGTNVSHALEQARSTLELLSRLDSSRG
jgi:hypothetical protein